MEQLGVQPLLLVAQIVNFGIVVFLLNKALFKPVIAFLDKRKKEIEEGLQLTSKMQEEDEKLAQKREKLLEVARKEAKEVTDEARKRAKVEEKEIIEEAHSQASKILEKARTDSEDSVRSAQKEIRREAILMAELMVEKLLPQLMTKSEQKKLVATHLKEIETRVH